MDCPHCHVALSSNDRRGIEIDTCPQCRGVWLDRGELDKMIIRSADSVLPTEPEPAATRTRARWLEADGRPTTHRRAFLSELFDD